MALTAGGTVHIDGLREMQRAFRKLDRETAKEVREALKKVGEPVRLHAEAKAQQEIRNIGPTWSRMKIGVRQRGVYIAPATRNRGGPPRKNLGTALLFQVMLPAVNEKEDEIIRGVERAFDDLTREAGF